MRKATRYYLLAVIMFLLALFQAVSGFVLWLVLHRGGGGYQGGRGALTENNFLWTKDTWIDLHSWVAVALLVMVLLHLILHWKWIVHMTKTCCRRKEVNQQVKVN